MTAPIHVIAEAGTNHGGRVETAEALAEAAVRGGADSVKFQFIDPDGLYLPRHWTGGRLVENPVFRRRAAAMLSDAEWRRVADRCRRLGRPFSASVFDPRGLCLLEQLDAPYVKLASCDLNHSRLLRLATATGRRVILSTGMATLGEIERAVAELQRAAARDVVLMHCVSLYPCPTPRSNVGFLRVLREAFGLPVGFSDHTENSLAAAAAVALGATVIEKHLTLDRSAEGFDHNYAMTPETFAAYVADVRAVEAACRRPDEKVGPDEREVRARARRSLYAARDLEAGESLSEADVLVVRPEGALGPDDLDRVLGRALGRAVRQYEMLTLDDLAGVEPAELKAAGAGT